MLWLPLSCQCGYLLMALQGRGWNAADLAFPSPALPRSWRGPGPDSRWSSVGLLGLASASRPSHLTFFKTAWDSRTGPKILAEASFLVVNGAGSPAVHRSQGRRSKTESAGGAGRHLPPLPLGEDCWRPGQGGAVALVGLLIPRGKSQQGSH